MKKKQYYQTMFLNAKNDMKKSWKNLRSLMGKGNVTKKQTAFIPSNANPIGKLDILNKFNDYFTKIGQSLADQVPISGLDPCSHIDMNPQSFFLYPVTLNEVRSIIGNLKNTKTHLDEIPVYI